MTWNHRTVYQALVAGGEREKQSGTNRYVTLYQPQPLGKNCALLYSPDAETYGSEPIHFHAWSVPPRKHAARESWRDDVFRKLLPALKYVRTDKDHQPRQAFSQFRVTDWDRLAKALSL
jgi:hypothetical protein